MTFVRTPATPRKPFGSAPSSLVPPFPPFGLPANQESVHSYLESSTFWNPAQQGGSGDSAEDFKATPLRIWGGSVVDVLITSLVVIRLSWAAGYLEIRNFAPGNSGCVRSAAQRRRRERKAARQGSPGSRTGNGSSDTPQLRSSRRTAESSGSTGRRTATQATCFRRLLLFLFFWERVAEDRCLCCRGRCPLCVLADLAGKAATATARNASGRAQGDGQEHRWQPCVLANLPLVARDAPTTASGRTGQHAETARPRTGNGDHPQLQHTGADRPGFTATKATVLRRLSRVSFFWERFAESCCFRCRGRCSSCVLANLLWAGGSEGNPPAHRNTGAQTAATPPPCPPPRLTGREVPGAKAGEGELAGVYKISASFGASRSD